MAALEKPGEELAEVGLQQNLGGQVDMSLPFLDEKGVKTTLGELAKDRPVIIMPVYYHCPRLCGLVSEGVTELVNNIPLALGKDFRVVAISIDPEETPMAALEAKKNLLKNLTNPEPAADNWHFLVGSGESIERVMTQVGFKYRKDGDEYAHTAAIMILTPRGEISQYFTGITFSTADVRLALVEASQGRIGSAFDQLLLFCFRFDHTQGKYTWAVVNVVRAVGLITLLALVSLVYVLYRRGLRQPQL